MCDRQIKEYSEIHWSENQYKAFIIIFLLTTRHFDVIHLRL